MTYTIFGTGEWSYSGNPASSARDELRFWVQDTDVNLPLLSDTELDYLLAAYSTSRIIYVAAVAAGVLATKFGTEVSIGADGVNVSVSELSEKWFKIAEELRDQYKSNPGIGIHNPDGTLTDGDDPTSMGPILPQILNQGPDANVPPLVFGTGHMDNWEVGRQDFGDYQPGSQDHVWGEPVTFEER
jgi:hypothetical protein